MLLEVQKTDLLSLLTKQLDNMFGVNDADRAVLSDIMGPVLESLEFCFSQTRNKYYKKQGQAYFNPFHSGQYSIFLYLVSYKVFILDKSNRILADKVYYLNKCLNGLDLFYEVMMPKVFFLDHPVGSVLGRARYGEYFCFSQNCTVGGNKGIYPTLGKNVKMLSGAKVLGSSLVGDNVIFSANAYVKDFDIPSCSIVFGTSPHIVIKQKEEAYFVPQE